MDISQNLIKSRSALKIVYVSIFLIFVIHNCSPNLNYEDMRMNDYVEKITDWQTREFKCLGRPDYIYESVIPEFEEIIKFSEFVYDLIQPLRDPNRSDKWQTSCETLIKKTGDCEDSSILLLTILRENGFGDSSVWIGIIDHPGETDHAVVVFEKGVGTFAIDANRLKTKEILPLSEYLILIEGELLFKFNLSSISCFY